MSCTRYAPSFLLVLFVASAAVAACARLSTDALPGAATGGAAAVDAGTPSTGGAGGTGGSSMASSSGGFVGRFMPGAAGNNGSAATGGAGGTPTCGLQSFELKRKPANMFLVLDRSGSMQNDSMGRKATPPANPSKWDQVVPALTEVITKTSDQTPWGMKLFPQTGMECSATSVTNTIDVPVAPKNGPAVTAAIAATVANGNGTPTSAAIDAAVTYLQTLNDGNPRYILLATDGAPTCGGTVGKITGNTPAARTDAVAAVTAAAAAGIHTFVVGVATNSTEETTTLNDMAVAGLEARPGTPSFYLAANQSDLVTALGTIAGMISTCSFPLDSAPPDPTNIAVKVSGMKAPQDTSHANGWDYSGTDHKNIQVFGSWCDMIKTSASNTVQIIYGCPEVVIPG